MVSVTGIGSWPGDDVREALRLVRGELLEGRDLEGVVPVPYLPELPARGPGADLVGRAAGLLVDLPVDLQAQGWRLVDRPGLDAERTAGLWRQDLDELAEAYDGWSGPLKLAVAGPWTMAAGLWLPLGDRVLSDAGATRDLADSLAEGVRQHVTQVQRLVPGATVTMQLDEPSLSAVVLGRVRSESGYRTLAAPEAGQASGLLRLVLDAARGAGASTVVHTCASTPPVVLLQEAGPDALSLDTAQLSTTGWDEVAGAVEAGTALWAGLLRTDDPVVDAQAVPRLLTRWQELGLPLGRLADVTLTPACGLAGLSPSRARELTAATVTAAAQLAERAAG